MINIPATMNACVLVGHGDLDALEYHSDWPTPITGPDEVLIKVGACGLNNTDVNTRSGWYSKTVTEATTGGAYDNVGVEDPAWSGSPIQFPRIQGADAVGTVVATGEQVNASLIGKRVIIDCWLRDWNDPMNRHRSGYFGSECDGGFAQYATADHRNAHVVGERYTDAELATFACAYSTAEGMLSRANVTDKDVVLIPGASGGVGSALVQLAKLRGARVVAMASESKHANVGKLHPHAILPRNPKDLAAALQLAIGSDTVSVVADVVGGDNFANLIDRLERGGRYTCSGAIAGPMVELDLRTLYLRDLTFTGSTVLDSDVFPRLVSYIDAGKLQPMLAASFPLADLKIAQQAFIDKKHTGNLVVIP